MQTSVQRNESEAVVCVGSTAVATWTWHAFSSSLLMTGGSSWQEPDHEHHRSSPLALKAEAGRWCQDGSTAAQTKPCMQLKVQGAQCPSGLALCLSAEVQAALIQAKRLSGHIG